jgi:maltooligosyltrehalose synthase
VYPPRPSSKFDLTLRILEVRREHAELFARGSYVPLVTQGPRSPNLVAFERRHDGRRAIVVAPRLVGAIRSEKDWQGTSVELEGAQGELRCEVSGKPLAIREGRMNIDATPLSLFIIG